jgi:hypothetical protein
MSTEVLWWATIHGKGQLDNELLKSIEIHVLRVILDFPHSIIDPASKCLHFFGSDEITKAVICQKLDNGRGKDPGVMFLKLVESFHSQAWLSSTISGKVNSQRFLIPSQHVL